LNRALMDAVRVAAQDPSVRPEALHAVWATGPAHYEGISEELSGLGSAAEWVHVLPYIEDMPVALASADLALARAGATFTAELLVQGLPAILVPLPSAAEDHQTRNAEALVSADAAVLIPQQDLDAATLWRTVQGLMDVPERLARMSEAARTLARPDAADEIAASVVDLLSPGKEVG
jgi:UDP-N-acetylglucosamine--N-acetylmuramyl-(pentapeptide) pyrophosphoryl-undecaprenol N-acetylglucosamine transferase